MTEMFQDATYPRLFSLVKCGLQPTDKPSQVLAPLGGHKLLYLRSDVQVQGHPTIGVYIDGACPGNGTPTAKGSYGVYFAPNSPYNTSGKLPTDFPQTSQRAELIAALIALEQIQTVNETYRSLELFIIITDSDYLVNSIGKYIMNWKRNNWISASRKEIVNRDLFERLDLKLEELYNRQHDIDILWWKVDRSENTEADRLANWALQ